VIPCDAQPVADSALEEVRIDWDPRRPPDRLFSTPATRSYDIFTDGSTPRDGGAVSGYAAVIYDSSDLGLDPVVLGSYLKCSGNNFLAEMCALVAALMAVPAQATVRIFSDSLACIQAVCRDDTAAKRRIRAAARPMLTSLRRLMLHAQGAFPFTTSAPTQVALTLPPLPTTLPIGEPMRSVPVPLPTVSGGSRTFTTRSKSSPTSPGPSARGPLM
jgi:hypothetical protein